jgi:hypothetical protein
MQAKHFITIAQSKDTLIRYYIVALPDPFLANWQRIDFAGTETFEGKLNIKPLE